MQMYKILNEDGTAVHGGSGSWPLPQNGQPGEWVEVDGPLAPCQNGLHLCGLEHLVDWIGPALFEAEYEGEIIDAGNKHVVRRARLLRRVDAWNDRTLRRWACDCAERALTHDSKAEKLNAARAAIWDAAWNAARNAAGAAAWAAAEDGARDAAWNAAWDAAWDAERRWQIMRLGQYITGEA